MININPEELYQKMQQSTDAIVINEDEMTAREYLDKYFNTNMFSIKKYLRLANEEKIQRRKNRQYVKIYRTPFVVLVILKIVFAVLKGLCAP